MAEPFLVVGAMKSGTTTLHALLDSHSEVEVVSQKEANTLHQPGGAAHLASRIRASSRRVAGEVSAGYMQAPVLSQPTQEARRALGDQTLVVAVLREPFARAVSHWRHLTAIGQESRPLGTALGDESSVYVAFSRYHRQLAPWIATFGQDRMCPLRLEDLADDPRSATSPLWAHLGVGPLPPDASQIHLNRDAGQAVAGRLGRVARSRLYRQVIRPLVPQRARTTAKGLAPSAGTIPPPTGSVLESARAVFTPLVAADLAELNVVWPQLTWENGRPA